VKKLVLVLFLCLCAAPVLAVEPDEMLADPVLEERARALSKELRCLVCQGEDIDSSQAPFAADLRRLLRERLEAGDTDAAALKFIRDRYGDYVMLNPPFTPLTALLWAAPALVLAAGTAVALRYIRRLGKEDA
jgi:cytochrome c-type biogenesis protein CcmH